MCNEIFALSLDFSFLKRERNPAFSLLSIENWNHLYCEKLIHFFSYFIRKMYRTKQQNNELHKKLEQCFDPSQNPLVSQIHPLWLFIFKHFYSVLDVNKLTKYKIKVVRIDLHSFSLSLSLWLRNKNKTPRNQWGIKATPNETKQYYIIKASRGNDLKDSCLAKTSANPFIHPHNCIHFLLQNESIKNRTVLQRNPTCKLQILLFFFFFFNRQGG